MMAHRRINPSLRKVDNRPVAVSPITLTSPVVARVARSAAVISQTLTQEIDQAPWPPITLSLTITASWSSSELFVSSLLLLVYSPVALYESDTVVSGTLPLGALSLLPSPVFKPVITSIMLPPPHHPLQFPRQLLPHLLPFWRS